MKAIRFTLIVAVLAAPAAVVSMQRSAAPVRSGGSTARVVAAANTFLAALTGPERKAVTFGFDRDEYNKLK